MEMLRTTTPEMVRKEIAMHFLAYNLIRGLMAEAAQEQELNPRTLSFMGAAHSVRQFEQNHLYDPTWIKADLPRLLELIGEKRLLERPDRYEPRAVKQRPKPHPLLNMPRRRAKRLIERGMIPYDKSKYLTDRRVVPHKPRAGMNLRYPRVPFGYGPLFGSAGPLARRPYKGHHSSQRGSD